MTEHPEDATTFPRSRFWFFVLFLLVLLVTAFAVRNAQSVEVDLLAHRTQVPLAVLLLVTFAGGMCAGVAGATPFLGRTRDRPGNLRLLALLLGPPGLVILLGLLLLVGW